MARLAGMAYDTELADRIRFLIGTGPGVTGLTEGSEVTAVIKAAAAM